MAEPCAKTNGMIDDKVLVVWPIVEELVNGKAISVNSDNSVRTGNYNSLQQRFFYCKIVKRKIVNVATLTPHLKSISTPQNKGVNNEFGRRIIMKANIDTSFRSLLTPHFDHH
jgi:hypothetical protein